MKKTEFLTRLNDELNRRNVADAVDIVEEYAQHFDLKPADGYFEEEIAARLRSVALVSLALFAACFVLAYVVCALFTGSFQFWHVWGWFRYRG